MANHTPFSPALLVQAADQRRGLGAAVGLHQRPHHVDAAGAQLVSLLQHPEGLAHAGGEPQVELETAALAALEQLEEVLRPGALRRGHRMRGVPWLPARDRRATRQPTASRPRP